MNGMLRRWRFLVEDECGDSRYVGPDGEKNEDAEWIGTDADADREADRRADAWENRPENGWAVRVVCESQGKVAEEGQA